MTSTTLEEIMERKNSIANEIRESIMEMRIDTNIEPFAFLPYIVGSRGLLLTEEMRTMAESGNVVVVSAWPLDSPHAKLFGEIKEVTLGPRKTGRIHCEYRAHSLDNMIDYLERLYKAHADSFRGFKPAGRTAAVLFAMSKVINTDSLVIRPVPDSNGKQIILEKRLAGVAYD